MGELGFELYVPVEFAGHVYETLWDTVIGAAVGTLQLIARFRISR